MLNKSKNKDLIISEISDSYKEAKMLGDNPNIEYYLDLCPAEYKEELGEDIEDWKWLIGWKYEGSAEEIGQDQVERLIARIQPQLDQIDEIGREKKKLIILQGRIIGKFTKIRRLSSVTSPRSVYGRDTLLLAAKRKRIPLSGGNYERLNEDKEINADVFGDACEHLIVHLIGPKDKIANIPVAICEKKRDGSEEVKLLKETNEAGQVDFGAIEAIPQVIEGSSYILKIKTKESPE